MVIGDFKTRTTTDTGIRLWATEHRPSTLPDAATPDTPWPARSTESGQQQPGSKAGWTHYQGHATWLGCYRGNRNAGLARWTAVLTSQSVPSMSTMTVGRRLIDFSLAAPAARVGSSHGDGGRCDSNGNCCIGIDRSVTFVAGHRRRSDDPPYRRESSNISPVIAQWSSPGFGSTASRSPAKHKWSEGSHLTPA